MAKLHILFTLVSSITLIFAGAGESTISNSEPTEMIRIYLHGFLHGPNVTVYEVARASVTAPPEHFGSVRVVNDLMTSGPDLTTGVLGRAEVLIAFAGRTEATALLHLVLLFQNGMYDGSSLSLLGRARMVKDMTEEVPIVGGTGQFRAARGYAVPHMHSLDPVSGHLIYVYDLYLYSNNWKSC